MHIIVLIGRLFTNLLYEVIDYLLPVVSADQ
jgi:hypothetical protein